MKNLILIIPFLLIGCSDSNKKVKYQKMVVDPSYTEITPKKIKHSMKQTMDVVDPFATKLVEVQQIGDEAMQQVVKDRKKSRKTPKGRKEI
jgi:uncharacterized protein YcfL